MEHGAIWAICSGCPRSLAVRCTLTAFQQLSYLIRHFLAVGVRQTSAHSRPTHCRDVVSEHIALYPAQRRCDRVHLIDHVQAVPLIDNHLLQSPHLALYSAESRQLAAVIDRLMARLLLFAHDFQGLHTVESQLAFHTSDPVPILTDRG